MLCNYSTQAPGTDGEAGSLTLLCATVVAHAFTRSEQTRSHLVTLKRGYAGPKTYLQIDLLKAAATCDRLKSDRTRHVNWCTVLLRASGAVRARNRQHPIFACNSHPCCPDDTGDHGHGSLRSWPWVTAITVIGQYGQKGRSPQWRRIFDRIRNGGLLEHW